MPVRAIALWAFLLLLVNSAAATAQEKLILVPERPKVGQPFKVVLDPLPAENAVAGEYAWEIKVQDADGAEVAGAAPSGEIPNLPELALASAGADLRYDIRLTRSRGGVSSLFTLQAESGGTVLVQVAGEAPAAAVPAAPMPGVPPVAPAPGVPAAPPPPLPAPTAGELREMNARLNAAKRWAEDLVALPKSDDLMVPVEFFVDALARRADGKEGLLEFSHRPLLDATVLHRAMYGAANRFPAETDADSFISAWQDEKRRFIQALAEENADTPFIQELWSELADRWEREVLARDKERFREALLQAPMIVAGLLLDFDKKHIEAALTGGPPAGTSRGTTTTSGGYYGTSHAAVRHHRIMSRIHYRHERRMTRIGY